MQKLGPLLIIFSFLPWLAIPLIVPFLVLSIAQKALLVSVLVAIAEVLFWLGVLLVGKEVAHRYRRYLSFRYVWKKVKKLWQRS